MKPSSFIDSFDLDVTLRDAALDLGHSPIGRMIANAVISMEVEDAYYAA